MASMPLVVVVVVEGDLLRMEAVENSWATCV